MQRSTRKAEREEFWRLVLSEFERSGMTARAFCAQEGISEPSFYSWRRRIRDRDTGDEKSTAPRSPARLVPVEVVDNGAELCALSAPGSTAGAAALEIVTPGGFVVRVRDGVQPAALGVLLDVILERQPGAVQC